MNNSPERDNEAIDPAIKTSLKSSNANNSLTNFECGVFWNVSNADDNLNSTKKLQESTKDVDNANSLGTAQSLVQKSPVFLLANEILEIIFSFISHTGHPFPVFPFSHSSKAIYSAFSNSHIFANIARIAELGEINLRDSHILTLKALVYNNWENICEKCWMQANKSTLFKIQIQLDLHGKVCEDCFAALWRAYPGRFKPSTSDLGDLETLGREDGLKTYGLSNDLIKKIDDIEREDNLFAGYHSNSFIIFKELVESVCDFVYGGLEGLLALKERTIAFKTPEIQRLLKARGVTEWNAPLTDYMRDYMLTGQVEVPLDLEGLLAEEIEEWEYQRDQKRRLDEFDSLLRKHNVQVDVESEYRRNYMLEERLLQYNLEREVTRQKMLVAPPEERLERLKKEVAERLKEYNIVEANICMLESVSFRRFINEGAGKLHELVNHEIKARRVLEMVRRYGFDLDIQSFLEKLPEDEDMHNEIYKFVYYYHSKVDLEPIVLKNMQMVQWFCFSREQRRNLLASKVTPYLETTETPECEEMIEMDICSALDWEFERVMINSWLHDQTGFRNVSDRTDLEEEMIDDDISDYPWWERMAIKSWLQNHTEFNNAVYLSNEKEFDFIHQTLSHVSVPYFKEPRLGCKQIALEMWINKRFEKGKFKHPEFDNGDPKDIPPKGLWPFIREMMSRKFASFAESKVHQFFESRGNVISKSHNLMELMQDPYCNALFIEFCDFLDTEFPAENNKYNLSGFGAMAVFQEPTTSILKFSDALKTISSYANNSLVTSIKHNYMWLLMSLK